MDNAKLIALANQCGIKGPLPARQGFRMSASPASLLRFANIIAAHERSVCRDYCLINAKDAPTFEERDMARACARSIEGRNGGTLEAIIKATLDKADNGHAAG